MALRTFLAWNSTKISTCPQSRDQDLKISNYPEPVLFRVSDDKVLTNTIKALFFKPFISSAMLPTSFKLPFTPVS